MMSSQRRCESTPSLKPVFALGGSVSGYASMGSIESLSGDSKRENRVWSTEDIIGEQTEEMKGSQAATQTDSPFKSSFAQELEEENLSQSVRIKKCSQIERDPAFKSDFAVKVHCVGDCKAVIPPCPRESLCQKTKKVVKVEIPTTLNSEAIDEFSRVKLENEILKLKLKSFNQDDDKYKKLQSEIDQLTWQLSKMEQSRLVYENATNQLGSFLEMVSTQLTLTKPAEDAEPEPDGRMSRRRSRSSKSDKIQTLPRRKSTPLLTNTPNSKPRSKLQFEDPSLSRSTSCASSSLDSSCQSENGRFSTRTDKKTLETVNERRYRKGDNDDADKSANDDANSIQTELTCQSSLASSCLGGEEKLGKSKSKTRKALGRITSFMRKDKSQNFSLENSSRNSLKYSSEHFSEPSSMSIIGFRGIWSLRNY